MTGFIGAGIQESSGKPGSKNAFPHPRLQDETNLRLDAENNLAAYRQVREGEGRWKGGGRVERVDGSLHKHRL